LFTCCQSDTVAYAVDTIFDRILLRASTPHSEAFVFVFLRRLWCRYLSVLPFVATTLCGGMLH
jgi:hypothetical protein